MLVNTFELHVRLAGCNRSARAVSDQKRTANNIVVISRLSMPENKKQNMLSVLHVVFVDILAKEV